MSPPAVAFWKAQYSGSDPNTVKWYRDQHNAQGQWCCDKSDGHDFYEDYTLNKDGSVDFDSEGKHYHLPSYMVLSGPNPTGHAVWWFLDTEGGRQSYCFATGGGT